VRTCRKCGEARSAAEFYAGETRPCKPCVRAGQKRRDVGRYDRLRQRKLATLPAAVPANPHLVTDRRLAEVLAYQERPYMDYRIEKRARAVRTPPFCKTSHLTHNLWRGNA
jgi:hypothetical protein